MGPGLTRRALVTGSSGLIGSDAVAFFDVRSLDSILAELVRPAVVA